MLGKHYYCQGILLFPIKHSKLMLFRGEKEAQEDKNSDTAATWKALCQCKIC
jgi:hypothetical protein